MNRNALAGILLLALCTMQVQAAAWQDDPRVDFDKILFVQRHTYTADHYYSEYINSRWLPGGNLCTLDIKTGQVENSSLS